MSGLDLVLAAAGSHLYPGAGGPVRGADRSGACLVEFADGSLALGTLEADGAVLALGGYTTARGTEIPPKRWAVVLSGSGTERRFRVAGRLPSSCG